MRKKYEITVMLSQGLKTLCYQIIFTICLQNTVSAGVGTTSGVFLNEPIGARPSSMGGAFSAVSDDANSIYSNPAGYHYMPNSEITTMYNKMLMDTSISYIGYVQPLKKDGTISASFLMFDGGNIEINSLDGTSETKKASSDWAGSVGYGTNLGELFFVGGNFKLIRSTLVEQYSATAVAFDVGGLYRSIDSKFSCGIAVYNLGTGLKYLDTNEALPFSIKTGVGYKVLEDEINSVLTSADINFGIIDKTTKVNMGVEYWLLKTLAIRAGYNPSSWTVGIGLNAFGGILDYGYAPMLDETTHKISLSFKFGSQDRIMLAEKYEEKGMYERAQYIRNPEDYMYAKAKGLTEANTYEEKDSFAPIVKSFEPKRASPGSEISIYGDKFGGAQSVTFGEEEAEILNKDNNRLIVKVPNVKAGNVAISVKTDKGSSLDKTFSVMPLKSPMLEVSGITFKDENGDNILGAEETGRIMFTIKNQKGAGESFGIKVKPSLTSGKNDLKFDDEILIGNIGSGEQKEVEISVKAGLGLISGKASFNLKFAEANEFQPEPVNITFDTHKLEPPDVQLVKFEIDDGIYPDNPEKLSVGNNNGIVESGESVEINAVIVNKGTGKTKNGVVKIICSDQKIAILSQSSEFDLGSIEPGKWKDVKFAIRVEKQYKGEQNLPIKLQFSESREMFNKDLALNIGLGRVYAKTQDVVIKGNALGIIVPTITSFGDDLVNIPAYTTAKKKNAYAVVVGIEKYRDIVSAEYAAKDAQTVKDYLINAMGFKEENIMYALNERGSRNDLVRYFNVWLKNNVEKNSEVFVYYSGHGAPDSATGDTFIVPYDGDPNTIQDSGYSLKQLYESLNKLPTNKVLVVIDACFSGAGGPRTVLAKGSRPLAVSKNTETGNVVVLSATGGGQISGSYEEKQHGLFTYFFLKGLQGEADTNKDKKIMLSELYEYLKPQVLRIARKNNRDQEPKILPSVNQIGEFEKLPLAVLK